MIDDEPAFASLSALCGDSWLNPATSDADEFGAWSGISPTVLIGSQYPQVDGIELLRFLGEGCQAGIDQRGIEVLLRHSGWALARAGWLALWRPVLLPVLKDALRKLMPLTLTSDLREAIETGNLVVHYQPKLYIAMALERRRCRGAGALAISELGIGMPTTLPWQKRRV
jgi:hypothetical protein